MLQQKGWEVTGSDQGVYPPVSDYLHDQGIDILSPYKANNVPKDIDMAVVAGNALIIDPDNPEVARAKELNVPVLNYPQVLHKFVVKDNSIVLVGNYGKGTVRGAIVHVLKELKLNHSYMVGWQMIIDDESLAYTESDWSVLECD